MPLPVRPLRVRAIIRHSAPYGDRISEQEAPVFAYLGLGEQGGLPSKTYEYVHADLVPVMLGLVGICRLSAHGAFHTFAQVDISPVAAPHATALAESAMQALGISPPSGHTDDVVRAIVRNDTREVLFYHWYVQGDGDSAVFALV